MSRVDDRDVAKRRADLRAAEKAAQQHKAERKAAERDAFAQNLDRRASQASGDRARQGRVARGATVARHDTAEEPAQELPESETEPRLPQSKAQDAAGGRRASEGSSETGAPVDQDAAKGAPPDAGPRPAANARRADTRQAAKDEKGTAVDRGGGRPAVRSDDDARGGKNNRGQGDGKQPQGSFKIPSPALMAPPPVVVPKDSPEAARMRALAQEIISRIVERVRVGSNAEGLPEFQIELRSSILSGLEIKVASNRGRIRATFLAKDRAVLRALRAGAKDLEAAMIARGLPIEAFEFEEG